MRSSCLAVVVIVSLFQSLSENGRARITNRGRNAAGGLQRSPKRQRPPLLKSSRDFDPEILRGGYPCAHHRARERRQQFVEYRHLSANSNGRRVAAVAS